MFLAESGLRGRIDEGLEPEEIRSLVMAAPVPHVLEQRIRAAVAALGQGPFAVRSSGVGEDGSTASFAGQFDSILHVHNDTLIDAVRACWAS